jgi:hypothetical protein
MGNPKGAGSAFWVYNLFVPARVLSVITDAFCPKYQKPGAWPGFVCAVARGLISAAAA